MSNPDRFHLNSFDADAADPEALATARRAIGRWEAIASILDPVIGKGETTRLFERSILLCIESYPWMGGASSGFQNSMNLNALGVSIAQQPAEIAAVAAASLLTTFHALLVSLLGESLAEQVLPREMMELRPQDDAK